MELEMRGGAMRTIREGPSLTYRDLMMVVTYVVLPFQGEVKSFTCMQ